MFYYIIPAIIEYVRDENDNPTNEIQSIYPSVTPKGKWVSDCVDNVNYLIKTNTEINGFQPIPDEDFDEIVSSVGFNPSLVRNWEFN